ncbi:transcriptional regulator NrdR [Candidatus Uhrbacteria bacterium RIFCSPHIGHO2_12_FULL_54_23]|uniref:Transcriptional repressor NrdR n=2 Tax=Candidatus Uhriibacteriota TaxID=1752732 RepID=A0A1F7UM32_9BACT|nr:MAG: transcriptional regulator NrdR [Candidatus Uhrbacteria bacterium RIFCSPHIGHO2_12_FULL_54_23]OGL84392.1 MAG: transcriptional regulator NrdR [Candidatus Uhrbacteria bacterium RIFCSPLOWO2_01_FULL_55_36]
MNCPVCNYHDTRVLDSRVAADGLSIRRRRSCLKCKYRFSTYEQVELLDLTIIKRDGRREPYDRQKLALGIESSLIKRSYTKEDFQKLINTIERDIQKLKKDELPSAVMGEIVMRHLERFDKVGYIRFASVYRQFEDVRRFQHEIKKLIRTRKTLKRAPTRKRTRTKTT